MPVPVPERRATVPKKLAPRKKTQSVTKTQFDKDGRSEMLQKKAGLDDAELRDFQVTHLLGVGAFGRVFFAELPATGKKYAIKTIRKDRLVEKRDAIKSVMIEFQVLLSADNPFLCNMDYFFMTTERMYFCMDFISGGTIQNVLKVQKPFPEERVKFYAMQLIIALGILH